MLTVLTFLKTPLGRYLMLGLAVLAILGGIYGAGRHSVIQADKARTAVARADIQARQATASSITAKASSDLSAERVRIQIVTRTLIQKVKVYVPAAADARCVVPVGFVQLYNSAAAGVPAPAGGPDPTASGLALSAVLETDVANLGTAHDWRAEVTTWRAWYADQKAAWDKR